MLAFLSLESVYFFDIFMAFRIAVSKVFSSHIFFGISWAAKGTIVTLFDVVLIVPGITVLASDKRAVADPAAGFASTVVAME